MGSYGPLAAAGLSASVCASIAVAEQKSYLSFAAAALSGLVSCICVNAGFNERTVARELQRCATVADTLPEVRASLTELRTGDIILFRSNGLIALATRVFERGVYQGSAWDHVGMVVERTAPRNSTPSQKQKHSARRRCVPGYCSCTADGPNDGEVVLDLLEATGAGVHVYPLEERLAKMARHHDYLAVRKRVGPDLTPAQEANLNEFLQTVCGRAYEKHPEQMVHAMCIPCCSSGRREMPKRRVQKLFRRGSLSSRVINKDLVDIVGSAAAAKARANAIATAEGMQTVFCAEIVAASLQVLELMRSDDIAPHDFIPSDFSHHPAERGLFDDALARAKRAMDAVMYKPQHLFVYPGAPYHKYQLQLKEALKGESKKSK
jgi:hypothetical protein